MERVCTLPRKGANRGDLRDLTLLATVSTAGPLAIFALGVGASTSLIMGLAALSIAALGTSLRLHQNEHPRISRASVKTQETESRWRRAAFSLIKGRHKATSETRSATVATGSGRASRGGSWLNR